MPFGDRTGPLGQGPRTGRGAGFCSGSAGPGSLNQGGGSGLSGQGRGGGRRFRNWFRATGLTGFERAAGASAPASLDAAAPAASGREQELEARLQSLAERFDAALERIGKRIEGLETKAKAE